mmetsp:Transcript_24899/g.78830  ORF Transcript_24899/g.78830 Transcript_24899/m.78830 type:complete len:101 (+) Transcript_24899:1121-1423(+)
MVAHTVRPCFASSFTTHMTSCAIAESSPDVGSSMKMIRGSVMSARPMLTRLACPPEIPLMSCSPITVSLHPTSPSSSIRAATRLFLLSRLSCSEHLSSAV